MGQAQYSENFSPRLFKNDFLEKLSHIHPLAPISFWGVIIALLACHIWKLISLGSFIGAFIAGLLIWTFAEYFLHRFLFHYPAKSPQGKRLVFFMHGIHHNAPRDKYRLLMHPVPGLVYSAALYGLFFLALPPIIAPSAFIGFLVGYLIYDYTHYSVHHFSFNNKIFRVLRSHHMAHHFKNHDKNYGVSSLFWDLVFHSKIEKTS